jgi:hypothetical protein
MVGVVVLVAIFGFMEGETFLSTANFANLINQGAAIIVLAMGLVFVLLLGEIDLSAGFTCRRRRRHPRRHADPARLGMAARAARHAGGRRGDRLRDLHPRGPARHSELRGSRWRSSSPCRARCC